MLAYSDTVPVPVAWHIRKLHKLIRYYATGDTRKAKNLVYIT